MAVWSGRPGRLPFHFSVDVVSWTPAPLFRHPTAFPPLLSFFARHMATYILLAFGIEKLSAAASLAVFRSCNFASVPDIVCFFKKSLIQMHLLPHLCLRSRKLEDDRIALLLAFHERSKAFRFLSDVQRHYGTVILDAPFPMLQANFCNIHASSSPFCRLKVKVM